MKFNGWIDKSISNYSALYSNYRKFGINELIVIFWKKKKKLSGNAGVCIIIIPLVRLIIMCSLVLLILR